LMEWAWNGWCPMIIVRFMQQRDCIEEGIVLRLRLLLTGYEERGKLSVDRALPSGIF
jgi:hypothetical protein